MKNFENKNKNLISRVANNISFLYFVEGDYAKAELYANTAIENERYNHKALVNKGNIHYIKEDYNKTKEYYLEEWNKSKKQFRPSKNYIQFVLIYLKSYIK